MTCLIGSLARWLNEWLAAGMIDWLNNWMIEWMSEWLIDWLIHWFTDSLNAIIANVTDPFVSILSKGQSSFFVFQFVCIIICLYVCSSLSVFLSHLALPSPTLFLSLSCLITLSFTHCKRSSPPDRSAFLWRRLAPCMMLWTFKRSKPAQTRRRNYVLYSANIY